MRNSTQDDWADHRKLHGHEYDPMHEGEAYGPCRVCSKIEAAHATYLGFPTAATRRMWEDAKRSSGYHDHDYDGPLTCGCVEYGE